MKRLDLILLDALSHCKGPAATDAVIQIADPRAFAQLDLETAVHALTLMLAEGYVERISVAAPWGTASFGKWQITEKGRAHLIASETREVMEEVARHTPIRQETMRIEEAPMVQPAPVPHNFDWEDSSANLRAIADELKSKDGQLRASPEVPEPTSPAKVTVCLDEFELDNWWECLDVDLKAEVFLLWSIGNFEGRASRVQDQDTFSIPILGTVGETAEEWAAKCVRAEQQKRDSAPHACVNGGD